MIVSRIHAGLGEIGLLGFGDEDLTEVSHSFSRATDFKSVQNLNFLYFRGGGSGVLRCRAVQLLARVARSSGSLHACFT